MKLRMKLLIAVALVLANGALAAPAFAGWGQQDDWTCGAFGWFESCSTCYFCYCGDDSPPEPSETC